MLQRLAISSAAGQRGRQLAVLKSTAVLAPDTTLGGRAELHAQSCSPLQLPQSAVLYAAVSQDQPPTIPASVTRIARTQARQAHAQATHSSRRRSRRGRMPSLGCFVCVAAMAACAFSWSRGYTCTCGWAGSAEGAAGWVRLVAGNRAWAGLEQARVHACGGGALPSGGTHAGARAVHACKWPTCMANAPVWVPSLGSNAPWVCCEQQPPSTCAPCQHARLWPPARVRLHAPLSPPSLVQCCCCCCCW